MTGSTNCRRRAATNAARRQFVSTTCLLALLSAHGSAPFTFAQPRSVNCRQCHVEQARQFDESVHRSAVMCRDCHGGTSVYELSPEQWTRFFPGKPAQPSHERPSEFDHGVSFAGKPTRSQVPESCGNCHADVERMNPYGLKTDQLASYRVSGHGKRLALGDERVAVCLDCHGAHDVARADDPLGRTYFKNLPATCAACHSDTELMAEYNLSPTVVREYRESVHGRNVLEAGDAGSPNCATCHGSHAAAPPGFAAVGHVCGQCHKQIEDNFLESVHGRVPIMARCIGCHGGDGNRTNHHIVEATPPVDDLIAAYVAARDELGEAADLRERFVEITDEQSGAMRFDTICANCHDPERRSPHAAFFESNDKVALQHGEQMAAALRDAKFEYAQAAARVERVARGVLLVQDEAMRVDDAKTELMALHAYMHTLNRAGIQTRVEKIKEICRGVHESLDAKQKRLSWRRSSLLPMWIFIALFSVVMYRKYKQLKYAWVRTTEHGVKPVGPVPLSRRMFDLALSGLGLVALGGLLWPAVAYVLPARRRGGGPEHVSAGSEADWAVGDVRKVAVRGKAVVVLRAEKGFRAFSAVCTHLGCIVYWEKSKRHFACPCHAATFDVEGKVVTGPPPKALPEYGVAVVQGEVIVKDLLES